MVSLADELVFEESDEISLTCNKEAIPTDEDNLIIKAAKLLSDKIPCGSRRENLS